MTAFVGIDPGISGALAVLSDDKVVMLFDTPTVKVSKRRTMDLQCVKSVLYEFLPLTTKFVLEEVHSMPKQGVVSSFSFGQNFGQWQGLLDGGRYHWKMVRPQVWKKHFGLIGKGKDAALVMARRMWPDAELHLKKHHGRADALLMAEWLRQTHG